MLHNAVVLFDVSAQECRANGPCSAATRLCTKKYYQATNQAELEAVLGAIFFVP